MSRPRDLCENAGSDSDLCTHFFQEKYVYDLKMKNQELQNFKFVLSYKIEESKKQIESRENDIETMKKQIGEVSNTLIWPLLLSPLSKYKQDPTSPWKIPPWLFFDFFQGHIALIQYLYS